MTHPVEHLLPDRSSLRQFPALEPGTQFLTEADSFGGVFERVVRTRHPQPRTGFSQAVVERTQFQSHAEGPDQLRVPLGHRAPASFLEALFQCLPNLGTKGIRTAGVVGTAVLEQDFDTNPTVGVELKLHGGAGMADGGRDLIKVVGGVETELDGQKPFSTTPGGFGAEPLDDQRGAVQSHPGALVFRAWPRLQNLPTQNPLMIPKLKMMGYRSPFLASCPAA